jgi:putative glycosyltransferase (TIGR04372 family)
MRSDFMDIYLGANCAFCISVGTGFDAVPAIFRRSLVFVNAAPLGYCCTSLSNLLLAKHHIDINSGHELTLHKIFSLGIGFCLRSSDYESKNVDLIENTPEEIRDVAVEMVERLNETWQEYPEDEVLQQRFWEIFPTEAVDASEGKPLHGEIRARSGANFLRLNPDWIK